MTYFSKGTKKVGMIGILIVFIVIVLYFLNLGRAYTQVDEFKIINLTSPTNWIRYNETMFSDGSTDKTVTFDTTDKYIYIRLPKYSNVLRAKVDLQGLSGTYTPSCPCDCPGHGTGGGVSQYKNTWTCSGSTSNETYNTNINDDVQCYVPTPPSGYYSWSGDCSGHVRIEPSQTYYDDLCPNQGTCSETCCQLSMHSRVQGQVYYDGTYQGGCIGGSNCFGDTDGLDCSGYIDPSTRFSSCTSGPWDPSPGTYFRVKIDSNTANTYLNLLCECNAPPTCSDYCYDPSETAKYYRSCSCDWSYKRDTYESSACSYVDQCSPDSLSECTYECYSCNDCTYYPYNPSIDTGDDGCLDWLHSGAHSITETNVLLNESAFDYYLSTCSASAGKCDVPLKVHSDDGYGEKMRFFNLNVTYDYNVSSLFTVRYKWNQTSEIFCDVEYEKFIVINHTTEVAANDVSINGYFISDDATTCKIDGTEYTPQTYNGHKYCPFSETITEGNKWNNHTIWFDTLYDKIATKTETIVSTQPWKKSIVVDVNTDYGDIRNITVDTYSSNIDNLRLKVYWNGMWHDITPATGTSDCNTSNPTYTEFDIGGDKFYVCKQDVDNDGIPNYFKWKQPHGSTTSYTLGEEVGVGAVPTFEPYWWNYKWSRRIRLNITNLNDTVTLRKGYPVALTINHKSLVSDGISLANGYDLRIIYWNESSEEWKELDRDVVNPNTTFTQIWFSTQKEISPNSYDDDYFLYYGNLEPPAPPTNLDNVYGPGRTFIAHYEGNSTGVDGEKTTLESGIEYVSGRVGKGVKINPGANFRYKTSEVVNTSEGTIEFWFRPEWNWNDNKPHTLIDMGLSPIYWYVGKVDNNPPGGSPNFLQYFIEDKYDYDFECEYNFTFQKGNWYHIEVTWWYLKGNQLGNMSLYANGILLCNKTGLNETPTLNQNFGVGDYLSTYIVPQGEANGTIDELMIWNYVKNPKDFNFFDPEPSVTMIEEEILWYYDKWKYRTMIIVNNTNNPDDLYDYQVGNGSGGCMNLTYLPGMKSDFSDIRFSWYNETSGKEEKIPYFIESEKKGEWVCFWFKVPKIKGGDTETVYIYYGNPYATSESNISAVFNQTITNGNFSTGDLSGWTVEDRADKTGGTLPEVRTDSEGLTPTNPYVYSDAGSLDWHRIRQDIVMDKKMPYAFVFHGRGTAPDTGTCSPCGVTRYCTRSDIELWWYNNTGDKIGYTLFFWKWYGLTEEEIETNCGNTYLPHYLSGGNTWNYYVFIGEDEILPSGVDINDVKNVSVLAAFVYTDSSGAVIRNDNIEFYIRNYDPPEPTTEVGETEERELFIVGLETTDVATRLTTLNDSKSVKNVTFIGSEEKTEWLRLPKKTTVFDAKLSLRGYDNPTNPYLDVGGDGYKEWSYSGTFDTSERTSDFSEEINDYLLTCTPDENGYCDVPLVLHSDSAGKIEISDIDVEYGNWKRFYRTILNDSSAIKNVTFTENENKTEWLRFPKDSYITYAKLNLRGYDNPTNPYLDVGSDGDVEWFWGWVPSYYESVSDWTNTTDNLGFPERAFDYDWSTASSVATTPDDKSTCAELIANYTLNNETYISKIRYRTKQGIVYGGATNTNGTVYFYNWTSNNWVQVQFINSGVDFYDVDTGNLTDFLKYFDGNLTLRVKIKMCAGATTGPSYQYNFYEGTVKWLKNYEEFNTSEVVDSFSEEINDYLLTCTPDENGYCDVPLVLHSDSAGKIEISDIWVEFLYNTSELYNITKLSSLKYIVNNTNEKSKENIDVSGYYIDTYQDVCYVNDVSYPVGYYNGRSYCGISFTVYKQDYWPDHIITIKPTEGIASLESGNVSKFYEMNITKIYSDNLYYEAGKTLEETTEAFYPLVGTVRSGYYEGHTNMTILSSVTGELKAITFKIYSISSNAESANILGNVSICKAKSKIEDDGCDGEIVRIATNFNFSSWGSTTGLKNITVSGFWVYEGNYYLLMIDSKTEKDDEFYDVYYDGYSGVKRAEYRDEGGYGWNIVEYLPATKFYVEERVVRYSQYTPANWTWSWNETTDIFVDRSYKIVKKIYWQDSYQGKELNITGWTPILNITYGEFDNTEYPVVIAEEERDSVQDEIGTYTLHVGVPYYFFIEAGDGESTSSTNLTFFSKRNAYLKKIGLNITNTGNTNVNWLINVSICYMGTDEDVESPCQGDSVLVIENYNVSRYWGSSTGLKYLVLQKDYKLEEDKYYKLIIDAKRTITSGTSYYAMARTEEKVEEVGVFRYQHGSGVNDYYTVVFLYFDMRYIDSPDIMVTEDEISTLGNHSLWYPELGEDVIARKEEGLGQLIDINWKKELNITTNTTFGQVFNITANTSISSILNDVKLWVLWGGSWQNITPATETNDCNTSNPTFTKITIDGDDFYVCKQDIDGNGKIDFFKWKQPHGSIVYYNVTGKLTIVKVNVTLEFTINKNIERIRGVLKDITSYISIEEILKRISSLFKFITKPISIQIIIQKLLTVKRNIYNPINLTREVIYDFKDYVNNKAYYNIIPEKPPTTLAPSGETEFSEEAYQNISESDDKYFVTESSSYFPYHRFNITINESIKDIEEISIEWEGHGREGRTINLYVYNFSSNSWILVASGSGTTDFVLNKTFVSDFSDIIKDGKIYVLVQDK